jgi:hypothetical protein
VADPAEFVGAASAQVSTIVEQVAAVVAANPRAGAYVPPPIL